MTAVNCGRPTPVIIRVVHIAPGPIPTLTMSAPALIRSRAPSGVTTLPATTGSGPTTPRTASMARSILAWCPCAVSTTTTSTPISARAAARSAGFPLIPTATALISSPRAFTAGR